MSINYYISDLFFNTDLSGAVVEQDGMFDGYDEALLKEEAEGFLECLEKLGVAVPKSADLIADFYKRL